MIAAAQKNDSSSKEAQADMVELYNFTTFDIMGDLTFAEPLNVLRDGEYVPWVEPIFATVKLVSLSHASKQKRKDEISNIETMESEKIIYDR